jgi:hypothetical protein
MNIEAVDGKLVGEYPSPWDGDFSCYDCNLTSLEGAPKEIIGNFYCCRNDLVSLKGVPEVVDRDFSCYNNSELLSIQNINHYVKKIGASFVADNNLTGLISLLLIEHPPIYADIGPLSEIFNKAIDEIHYGGKDRMEIIMDVILNTPEEYAWQLGDIE